MNLEEAVWYVAAAYAVVLVALLLLFAVLARRLVRLTQRVNALRETDQSDEPAPGRDGARGAVEAVPDGDGVRAAGEVVPDGDGATGPDAAAGGETPDPGGGAAAASAGRDAPAGDRQDRDHPPSGET